MNRDFPPPDCPLCPRLVALRQEQRLAHPEWHNAPVPDFGDPDGWLAIVGLAPGLSGANATGRPFTGDGAGSLLFGTLQELGFAQGTYGGHAADGLCLRDVLITNAVRCVPPGNKPVPAEIHACRPFLFNSLRGMPNLQVVLALGEIAHQSAVKVLGGKLPKVRFAHGAVHQLHTGYVLVDSYHCSRLNQNTGRLTDAMFRDVIALAVAQRSSTSRP
ncbi:MAG: uracil-DNA glycosylase [Sphingomonadaceae bacterium]